MVNFLLESKYFEIFGNKIYFYGVMITLGIIAGIVLAFWTFKKRGIKTDHIINLGLIAIPCAILGARIYYCTFIDNSYDFLSFFDITKGGLAVYGAIIGGALGVLVYCLIKKINFFKVADALVPCLAIGQCLGRIGCYFGGCCYGETTDLHFFPLSVEVDGVWRLATFFYESFATLLICIILVVLIRKINGNGFIFCGYFFLYGVARFLIEGVRGDSLYFLGMRVSQALSLVLIIASVALAVYLFFYHKKKGVIPPLFVNGGLSGENANIAQTSAEEESEEQAQVVDNANEVAEENANESKEEKVQESGVEVESESAGIKEDKELISEESEQKDVQSGKAKKENEE